MYFELVPHLLAIPYKKLWVDYDEDIIIRNDAKRAGFQPCLQKPYRIKRFV